MLTLAIFATAAVALGSPARAAALRNPVRAAPPVSEVELLRYIGRWVEVYSDLSSRTVETKYCVTVDYGFYANNTVSVRNRDR